MLGSAVCAGHAAEATKDAGPIVAVRGEVVNPGQYPFSPGLTIKALIDKAGGPRAEADLEHVRILRKEEGVDTMQHPLWGTIWRTDMSWINESGKNDPGKEPEPAILAGDLIEVPTKWQFQKTGMDFEATPLSKALKQLLDIDNLTYVLDPWIEKQDMKVTATFSGVTVEKALSVLCNTAGLSYEVKDNVLYVRLKQQEAVLDAPDVSGPGQETTAVITLKYARSGDIVPLIAKTAKASLLQAQGEHQLIVQTDRGNLGKIKSLVALLDIPGAYPKSIRVGIIAKGRVNGKTFSFSSENVGLEGEPIAVAAHIKGERYGYYLNAKVTPRLLVSNPNAKSIGVVGKTISLQGGCDFNVLDVSLKNYDDRRIIMKSFEFAVPVSIEREKTTKSGKVGALRDRPVIASDSLTMGANATDFEIRIYADVEKGGVRTSKAQ